MRLYADHKFYCKTMELLYKNAQNYDLIKMVSENFRTKVQKKNAEIRKCHNTSQNCMLCFAALLQNFMGN